MQLVRKVKVTRGQHGYILMSNCYPSFIVRWILNFVGQPSHENHENWYPTNKSDFTVYIYIYTNFLVIYIYIYIFIYFSIHKTVYNFVCGNMALWWSDVTIFENEEYRLLSFEIQCQPQINLIKLSIGGRRLGISCMSVVSSPFFGEMWKISLNLIWFIHCVYYDIFLNSRIVNSKIKLRNKSWNFIPSQKQG